MCASAVHIITAAWGQCTWLAKPVLQSLIRHWVGDLPAITLITDDPPGDLPDCVDVYDVAGRWEPRLYSDRLMDVMHSVPEPIVLVYGIDRYLLNDVCAEHIEAIADYMQLRGHIVGCYLAHEPSLAANMEHVVGIGDRSLVRCSNNKHCSLINGVHIGCSLFNKELLTRILEPFWSIWRVEEYGTRHMIERYPELMSVAVYPELMNEVDLSWTDKTMGTSGFWHLDMLPEEDRRIVMGEAPKVLWL